MLMTIQDQVFGAVTAWKENRGGGEAGMHSVLNALINRAKARDTDVYTECVRPLQFSSMTAPGDPMLVKWPTPKNVADWQAWEIALNLAETAATGGLTDLTGGATLYFAPAALAASQKSATPFTLPDGTQIPFPKGWNPTAVRYTVTIQNQVFFCQI